MELDTSYKKQGGEPWRTTDDKQMTPAAPSARGLLTETRVCLFQFSSSLQKVKLFWLALSASVFWAERSQMIKNLIQTGAAISWETADIFLGSAVLAVSNSVLNTSCYFENNSPLCCSIKSNSLHYRFIWGASTLLHVFTLSNNLWY